MPVAIGENYETRFYFQLEEQGAVCVRHYKVQDIVLPGAAEPRDLADAIFNEIDVFFQALQPDAVEMLGVGVQLATPPPRYPIEYSSLPAKVGTVISPPLPGQVSGLISLRANAPGRRGYLRTFVPFPAMSANSADHRPQGAYILGLEALGNLFLSMTIPAFAGRAGFVLLGIKDPTQPAGVVTLTSRRAVGAWATQRRRGRLGRPNPRLFS
jgi:hypothetical protein